MAVYNISKIENWYNDFVSAKNKFTNTYLSDFNNSYINKTSLDGVYQMKNRLNSRYQKINRIYKRIDEHWKKYLNDLKNADNILAGGRGAINDPSVNAKVKSLPTLRDYKVDLNIRLSNASAVVGTQRNLQWIADNVTDENIKRLETQIGCTITTGAVSVVEGVGILGEGIVDAFVNASAGIATGLIYVIDYLGGDMDSVQSDVDSIWADARSFTSKTYVKTAFDNLYNNTAVGNAIKENTFGFDTTRTVGNEIGEVVGAVAISTITGGAVNPAVIYGTAKVGNHIEENYQDETKSTTNAVLQGTFEGFLDGAFFALGMKGDAVMKEAALSVASQSGKNTLKNVLILGGKGLFESGCAVSQDVGNIFLNASFSGNEIQTADGQTIKFNSFRDKMDYYYQEAGGVKGLVNSMMTATFLSFMSDVGDVRKISSGVSSNVKNVNVKPEVNTRTELDLTALRNEYDDLSRMALEPGFKYNLELGHNGGAGDLNRIHEALNVEKRMSELEDILGINESNIPTTNDWTINADDSYYQRRMEEVNRLNSMKSEVSPEDVSRLYINPSPSGKQDLSRVTNPFENNTPSLNIEDLRYTSQNPVKNALNYLESNFRKFKSVNTNDVVGLNDKILTEHLYHFTPHADEILNSGTIKASDMVNSYGVRKTYFFAGIPEAGAYLSNLDNLHLKATALEITPTREMIENPRFKVREFDDGAISYNGNFKFNGEAEKAYFILVSNGNELCYQKVSREIYNNYEFTEEGKIINDFLQNKNNINAIKSDYYQYLTQKAAAAKFSNAHSILGLNKDMEINDLNLKNKLDLNEKTLNSTSGVEILQRDPKNTINESEFENLRNILNDWGQQRGEKNYAEKALTYYAKTGSLVGPDGKYYVTSAKGAREYLSQLKPDDVAEHLHNQINTSVVIETKPNIDVKPRNSKYLDNLKVDEVQLDKQLYGMAKEFGVSQEEVIKVMDGKIKEFVDNSDIGVRISAENLEHVLKSGELKNQFQTGTTNGSNMLDQRVYVENKLFNVPENTASADRPIYGMLFPKNNADYILNGPNASTYGEVVCIYKKGEIINDTTLTCGDSLEYYGQLNPIEASNPRYTGSATKTFGFCNSLEEIKNSKFENIFSRGLGYFEAQLHGNASHSIDNIEKIIFPSQPTKKMLKLLKKQKIPYVVMNAK